MDISPRTDHSLRTRRFCGDPAERFAAIASRLAIYPGEIDRDRWVLKLKPSNGVSARTPRDISFSFTGFNQSETRKTWFDEKQASLFEKCLTLRRYFPLVRKAANEAFDARRLLAQEVTSATRYTRNRKKNTVSRRIAAGKQQSCSVLHNFRNIFRSSRNIGANASQSETVEFNEFEI